MPQLFDDIRQAVEAERFIVSNHADDQLQEMAKAGRVDELAQHGQVYVRKTA